MLFSLHLTEQNHSPNQKITKNDIKNHIEITNHQKMGLFHEKSNMPVGPDSQLLPKISFWGSPKACHLNKYSRKYLLRRRQLLQLGGWYHGKILPKVDIFCLKEQTIMIRGSRLCSCNNGREDDHGGRSSLDIQVDLPSGWHKIKVLLTHLRGDCPLFS